MRRAWPLALAGLLLAGCGAQAPRGRDTPSTLDPKGDGARQITQEMWVQFAVGAAVFALIAGLLVAILIARARRDPDEETRRDERKAERWIILGGIALPVVVLSGLFGLSVHTLLKIAHAPTKPVQTIQVVAHRWWWEVQYPGKGVETANQLVVPVGQSVRIEVTSRDVIHSFWVPQLQRKIDAIPGQWNATWIHATRHGTYRGLCAEFCGLEHARMQFLVEAMPPADYVKWIADAQLPAKPPPSKSAARGLHVFLTSSCAYCHTIRGTRAAGEIGPNLTHVAARKEIAAGALPNTRGYLGGWIEDPQHQKPGALMPRTALSGLDLQSLLDYLETLK